MNLRSKLENLPLQEGDAVVIGLSGGADSVCLTHLLLGWEGISLYACHLNHSLRGEESERDAQFVRSFCEEWRIPCVVEKVCVRDLAVENGWTLEEAGREARQMLTIPVKVVNSSVIRARGEARAFLEENGEQS